MKELGSAKRGLGSAKRGLSMEVNRTNNSLFLTQQSYISKILHRFFMDKAKKQLYLLESL